MNTRPLMVLAALAAATEPDFGRATIERTKKKLREEYTKDPMGVTTSTVLLASCLFYRFEKGKNDKVKTFWDALEFVTTNLSVGYSKIFAETPGGKAIASALMTVGPSMSSRFMDTPETGNEPSTADVVARLDKILEALEKRVQP
jgi:voltage-gated potassium channel